MKQIRWEFPKNIEEAVSLINENETVLHAGGVHLSGKRIKDGTTFVSLDKLHLNYVKREGSLIKIGSMTDFQTINEQLKDAMPDHILFKSLGQAATTPLRNRITIGGSLGLAPNWSDLIGPLIALDAEVKIEGAVSGIYHVTEYILKKELKTNTLITEVIIPSDNFESWYYREGLIKNDHPVFTITLLAKQKNKHVEDLAVVLTGHTQRFLRLNSIENRLKGKETNQINFENIAKGLDVKFTSVRGMSSDYIKHLVEVQVERGLTELLK